MAYISIKRMAALFCDKIVCNPDAEKSSSDKKIYKDDKLQVVLNGLEVVLYEQRKALRLSNVYRKAAVFQRMRMLLAWLGVLVSRNHRMCSLEQ